MARISLQNKHEEYGGIRSRLTYCYYLEGYQAVYIPPRGTQFPVREH
jgi:hypothetical protein